ncbi:MAG: hypothetical protein EXS09_02205 [Gemmataceae bacterium]|nr:hypothetical protein [Gemmataceae bacterium]
MTSASSWLYASIEGDWMGLSEAKAMYKWRGQTEEWVNARGHSLNMLRVRGLQKVQAVLLIFALAHNLHRATEKPHGADLAGTDP